MDEEKRAELENQKPLVMPEFNKEEFLKKWDEENPHLVIPPEVIPEYDRDWILSEEEEL